MDLLNIKNMAQFHEFQKRLNRRNFHLSSYRFGIWYFGILLGGWKFATNVKFKQNISKIMPVRPKKHWEIGYEYMYLKLVIQV